MRVAGALAAVLFAVSVPAWAGPEPPPPDPAPPVVAPAPPAEAPAAPPSGTPPAGAPSSPPGKDPAPDPGLPARTDVTIDRQNQVMAGVGFGGPTGAVLRLDLLHGLGADVREEKERVKAVCAVPLPHCGHGFLLGAEAGSGGGKLSLGVGANARVDSEDFHGTVGVALQLSLARTWGSPIGTDERLTYLGPELDLYVLRFGLTLGTLWRVSGTGGASFLVSWGVGIRL
ncbi:MAG: hypothetical protein ACM3PV_00200 [Betaproteobacteria bacterium]